MAYLARRNANLGALLIVMLIPKAVDMFLLTPALQPLKSSEYRAWFYVAHSLNDLLMILLIRFRFIVSAMLVPHSMYRPLKIEKALIAVFALSIAYNLSVFGDFFRFWHYALGLEGHHFYDYYTPVKRALLGVEALILTYLTNQTIQAVKRLKEKGLIE